MAFDTRWAPWKQQFNFNSTQSGDIDDWASSAVTNPSSNYGVNRLISAGGFVFVFNLSYPATCYRTTVSAGGLGSWTSVSTGISTSFAGFELVWAGEYLYRIGGLDYTSGHAVSSSAVYYAPINVDGSIGSWTAAASLPDGRRYGSVILVGNRVYYLGGQKVRYLVEFSSFVEDSKDTVYYADLNTYGVLGSWSTGSTLPDLRGKSAAAIAGGTIYLIGGDKDSTKQSSIFTATISGDVVGSWSTSGYSLASGVSEALTCVTEDTLYFIGGIDGSNYAQYNVFYAGLNTSGEMTGAFSYGTALPGGGGLAHFDVLVTASKIYLVGGYGNSGLESYAVEAAFAGGADDYTLTPEDINLTPSAVSNSQTFYGASISLNLTASLLTNTSSVFAPTTTPGTVALNPTLLTNGQTFYAAGAANSVNPPLFTNTQTFYAPAITPGTVTLTPSRHTNTQTFYATTASPGAFALTPALFTNSHTFHAATLSPGVVALTPTLFTNSQTFAAPTVTPGEVTMQPQATTNTPSFFSPSVLPGAVTLSPELLTGEQEFFAPELTPGDVTLIATMRVTNSSEVFAPLIAIGDLSMAVPYTANQQDFYLPTASVGDVELAPQVLTNAQEFYELEAYIGALTLDPPFVEGVTEFFSCLVSEGGLPLVVPLIDNTLTFYNLSIELVGIPLPDHVSGLFSDDSWTSTLDQPWEGVVLKDNRISVGIS